MADFYDVIVVGGGISGLTTAYHLKKRDKNLRVIVLEAKDRVGGRTQTVELKARDGTDRWDVGGQWVGRCQPHILSLLLELGLETHPQYTSGMKVQQLGGPGISYYSGDLPSLSVFALIDLHRFVTKLFNTMFSLVTNSTVMGVDSLRKEVNPSDPYACPMAEEWDSMTFEQFIQEQCYTQGAIDSILVAVRTIYGVEASQLSLLFMLTYTSAADGILKICEAKEFTAQESTIKGGAQQVSKMLAKVLGRENVRLEEPVSAIEQRNLTAEKPKPIEKSSEIIIINRDEVSLTYGSKDSKGVTVTTSKGQSYSASYVVLALPPPLLENIKFSPQLPEIKKQMCKRMAIGNYIKIIITFQEAFWRSGGYSGEVVTNGGMTAVPNCSAGPVCIVYDACLHNGSPALLGFIAGDIKVEWSHKSPEARRRAVLDQLADYFGKDVYSYLDYVEKDWNTEPYSIGGPVCSMPAGTMPFFAKSIRQPFERLHFAGTETATVWCGYMNGAVQAGLRAAAEILEIMQPQSLVSEDYYVLEGSRPVSKPSHGLSKPRWLIQPRKPYRGAGFLRWTIGFCVMAAILYSARKSRFSRFLPRF